MWKVINIVGTILMPFAVWFIVSHDPAMYQKARKPMLERIHEEILEVKNQVTSLRKQIDKGG